MTWLPPGPCFQCVRGSSLTLMFLGATFTLAARKLIGSDRWRAAGCSVLGAAAQIVRAPISATVGDQTLGSIPSANSRTVWVRAHTQRRFCNMAMIKRKARSALDLRALLATVGAGRTTRDCRKNQTIFSQGDRADAVFFVEQGKVKLTVLYRQGKQAVIGDLGPGSFFGEGCVTGQPIRMATATAITDSSITLLPKQR